MSDASAFTKLVPGFDFLQGLVKNAGSALPSIGQWVAPTLNPEELEKRIEELRTVQFWLEQNARMIGATIQALEVQRMTLSTLKTMNVQMTDLRDALTIKPGDSPFGAAAAAAPAAAAPPAGRSTEAEAEAAEDEAAPPAAKARRGKAAAAPAAGVVDPMQWWGALTKQFTQLATTAMKDTATDAARGLAGAVVKQGVGAAAKTLKKAAAAPAKAATRKAPAARKATRR